MHCILFLRLEGFYAKAHNSEQPLVVHRDKRVLDANALARERNIYSGMPLSEAKAILQGGGFVAWEEEPYRALQAQWLDLCTEFADVIEPCEQHSAWIDLSAQPDPELLALNLVRAITEKFGLTAIPGMAGSKWIAKLASDLYAQAGPTPLESSLAMHSTVKDPLFFLATLKASMLTPVEPEHLKRLEFLGYRTIGDIASVPLYALRGQFGDAATHIRRCARGGHVQPVQAMYPPNSFSARIAFEGYVEDMQVLDQSLQELARTIGERLNADDKQAKALTLTLEFENSNETRRRKFTKPIQNYASALSSLRLMLAEIPKQPLLGLRARLENVTCAKRVQQELSGCTTRSDRERGAAAAFNHIKTVFGDAAIAAGNELIEPRRKQVLRAWRDATGWA